MLQRPSELVAPVSTAVGAGFFHVPPGHVAVWDHAKNAWRNVHANLYDLDQCERQALGLVESIEQAEGMLRNQRGTLEKCRGAEIAATARLKAAGKAGDARERAQREVAEAGQLVVNAENGEQSLIETLADLRRLLAESQTMIESIRSDIARTAVKPGAAAMEVR